LQSFLLQRATLIDKMSVRLVRASSDDAFTSYTLTRELIEYHKALDIFELTEHRLAELIADESICSYIALCDGKPAGVMNYFWKYTTFTGRKILYIEDLYVRDENRGKGVGKAFIDKAKELAEKNDCEQIELKCINWNKSSAEFYKAVGFEADNQWISFVMEKTLFQKP